MLSIEQKLEICRHLRGSAISITALSKELDIGKSDIKKSEEKLTAFATGDLAIFVLTDDRQTDTTDHFTPCACAWGNNCMQLQRVLHIRGISQFTLLHYWAGLNTPLFINAGVCDIILLE